MEPLTKSEAAEQLESAYQATRGGEPVQIGDDLVLNILGRSFPVSDMDGSVGAEGVTSGETARSNLLYLDVIRGFDALIGEIDGTGEGQRKTSWMAVAWHRRLTWLRWLREFRCYVEDKETMALARIVEQAKCRCGHARADHFAGRGMSKEELHPCSFDSCLCLKFDAGAIMRGEK